MSQQTNYESMFNAHYTAIQEALKNKRLITHNLTDLGFKRSQQALDAGYLLLRNSIKQGQRTLPAVWVSKGMLEVFLDVCLESVEQKAQQKEASLLQSAAMRDQLDSLLEHASPLERTLAHSELTRNPKRMPDRIMDDVRRVKRLIDSISGAQEYSLNWATNITFETPLTAIKSSAVLLISYPVVFDNPEFSSFNTEKKIRLSVPSDIGTKKLLLKFQEMRTSHDIHMAEMTQFLILADYWQSHIPNTIWHDILRRSIDEPKSIHEMILSVLSRVRQNPSISSRVESMFSEAVRDIPGCSPLRLSHTKKSFLYNTDIRGVGVTLSAEQLLIQAFKDPVLSMSVDESFNTIVADSVRTEKLQYEASFDTVIQTLRKVISPVFDDGQLINNLVRQMPQTVNGLEFNQRLRDTAGRVREHFSSLLSVSDLVNKYGDDWVVSRYVHARALKRKIVIYAGPTNSGKTYQAYESVKNAQSILYLAPLRLLAMEGYDKLLSMGLDASLITGEERLGSPEARYVASTVEMCNPNRIFDAAIIDEAQMLCDPDRGSAWTAALLGVAAREVYLTCPEEAVDMLQSLFALTGESVDVVRLERKSSLRITEKPVSLDKVAKGTAFVAFSRRDLLSFKDMFESQGFKCALVYGALSPEVRRAQAQLFNSGEADILLSTDAIAMGLNLPIQHVVIGQDQKFNGTGVVDVEPALLRQIGGRAGRYGITENGLVSGVDYVVHKSIKDAFRDVVDFHVHKFALGLDHTMVEVLSKSIGSQSLTEILAQFKKVIGASASSSEFVVKCTEMQQQMFFDVDEADIMEGLALNERFSAACAPVNKDNYEEWRRWLSHMSCGLVVNVPELSTPSIVTGDAKQLKEVEEQVALLNLYRWMHYQFPETYPDLALASTLLKEKDSFIHESLKKTLKKRCLGCGCALSMQWVHPKCDSCFKNSFARRDYAENDWY